MKIYTVHEVAEILRISKEKAYKLIASGEIKKIQSIKSTRVTEEELNKFIRGE